jgi:hypothetical protein
MSRCDPVRTRVVPDAGVMVLLAVLMYGCTSAPSLSTQMQAGFNIAGMWILDPARSDRAPDARQVVDEIDRRSLNSRTIGDSRQELVDSTVFAFIAQDFPVLRAERLEIEQQSDSVGIRYEPGGYRDVSWGERTRGLWTITAGWNDAGEFVIHSDSEDIQAVERYVQLDARTLQIMLRVRADGGDLDIVRTFVKRG